MDQQDGTAYARWHHDELAEDYADTDSPLVIKIDPLFSRSEVVKHLRAMADGIEYCNDHGERAIPVKLPGIPLASIPPR